MPINQSDLVATFSPVSGPNGANGAVPAHPSQAFVLRANADPSLVMTPITPQDFNILYPQPLDPELIYAMCSETHLVQNIPEEQIGTKGYQWYEINQLTFASGTIGSYMGFATNDCAEPYQTDGDLHSVTMKNIGAFKALSIPDIMHSRAVAMGTVGLGINQAVGPYAAFAGLPGANGASLMGDGREFIADLKEKSLREAMILVANGEDWILAKGNSATNSLIFDGIETQVTAANGAHTNDNTASGTFSATSFDRFLGEACATPDTIFGHPAALQELASAYFQLGFQGSQLVNYNGGQRIVPGFNFASEINTAVGTMRLVADSNFTRTNAGGGAFQTSIYPLKTRMNGENLVVRKSQIPLVVQDLAPGCMAVQFQVWKRTALIIKAMCAQNKYTAQFTGRITTTCPTVG